MSKQKKNTGMSARERRRQRRVRNQIAAYITLVVLLLALGVGLFFGGRYLTGKIADKRQEKALEEEMAALAQAESEAAAQESETEETESAPEYSEDDLLNEMVDAGIAEMPIEDRVAGLFLTTPEALTGTDNVTRAGDGTQKALAEYPVGGLVYAASNVQSAEQFTKMLTDTIPKSKYPLFLILGEQTDALTEDASVYGINMEFTEDGGVHYTSTLPSLVGENGQAEQLVTAVIEEEDADAIAAACFDAWTGGADLIYVSGNFKEAYEGMLAKIQDTPDGRDKLTASLERIYRVKYRSRLSE